MKKLFFALAIVLSVPFAVNAQTIEKKEKKEQPKTELKAHVCTAACTTEKHVYAHGEVGHVCTDACKKTTTSTEKAELKDHVCTEACKDGKHAYAHGEKGHVCTEACKKKM
jgi:hypothetical protein